MKKVICFLVISICVSCYNVERNCNIYKVGEFKSEINIDNIRYISKFTRGETLQVENYNGKIDSSEVRWINDCEVIFKTINPKNMEERKDVHLKILTTTDSSYTFEYSYVGSVEKENGVAYKIK